MNRHYSKTDEVEQWEERRELRDPIGNTSPLGPRDSHPNVRNSGFDGSLSHHDPQVVSGVPTLVASDASSAEESRDFWWNNSSPHSSLSPDRKRAAKPDVSPISQPASPPRSTIELSPGVHVRLRGADETWKAIANDFYMPAECICCELMIFCIQNADYVLCPDCRVVSRMEDPSSAGVGDVSGVGGVGLGFKYEDLARWQEDILR
jgi:hypothetical protein